MSATPKVTRQQVEQALAASAGRISRAAVTLGIARNNLYKRMSSLGISADTYRKGTSAHGATAALDSGEAGMSVPSNVGERASVSTNAIYPTRIGERKFRGMRSTAEATEPVEEAGRVPRASRSLYLRPEQFKALDDASIDLPAVLREKLSPSKVMEMFMDECFTGWLTRALKNGGGDR